MKQIVLAVECYSGRKAESVLDQWYDPESISYKIRADDGNVYILRHPLSRPDGEWVLVSFRQTG